MDVDVIVIGTGQAGVPLATRFASSGKRVVVAERAAPGGTCINYGCTPTKTMVASARAAHVARTAERLGVRAQGVTVDLAAVVARKDEMVRRWRDGVSRRISDAGKNLEFVEGQARFVAPREIELGGKRYRGDVVVVNVGARPAVPRLDGLESVSWLDNHLLMQLRELPEHLVVLGGGYVGCEFGQMFRRFGSKVTIVDRGDHLLGRGDVDVSEEVEGVFRGEGIELRLGRPIRSVAREGAGVALCMADGPDVAGSHLLVAGGRVPNTDDLGCEEAGIRRDPQGFIVVGDHYETTSPGVYAVGDATPQPQFTHTSWDDHRLLFDHLAGRAAHGRSGRIIASTVFTDPQVATVGWSEREARARGVPFEVATLPFTDVARAAETGETAGLLKVLIDRATERILGAAIVGAQAGELIHVFVALIQAGQSARPIVDAEFVHPTFAEGLQAVVMKLERYSLR
jgi:pyruvate/2-oxoglutarate dehydrogenase complex dihydrolipoamide dehydrogenase (E3) component